MILPRCGKGVSQVNFKHAPNHQKWWPQPPRLLEALVKSSCLLFLHFFLGKVKGCKTRRHAMERGATPREIGVVEHCVGQGVFIRAADGDVVNPVLWFVPRHTLSSTKTQVKQGDRVSFVKVNKDAKPNPLAGDPQVIVNEEARASLEGQSLSSNQSRFWFARGHAAPHVLSRRLVLPRQSPEILAHASVVYSNGMSLEYDDPESEWSLPAAVFRWPNDQQVVELQRLVDRMEIAIYEADQQMPEGGRSYSAWCDLFLLRLDLCIGEKWTWTKLNAVLGLGEARGQKGFWRVLRGSTRSFVPYGNVLEVSPVPSNRELLFEDCNLAERPIRWEIANKGLSIKLYFSRPELPFFHRKRLDGKTVCSVDGHESKVAAAIDVSSLMPIWRMQLRTLIRLPEPIFPGVIRVVDAFEDSVDAIDYLVASLGARKVIGIWSEWGSSVGHEYNPLQLLQLATETVSVVMRVGGWKSLPERVMNIFHDTNFSIIALGGQEISKKLLRDFGITIVNGVDALDIPVAQRVHPRTLKSMVACLLEWNVGMTQMTSQWNARKLSNAQIVHAATRPWLVVMLYKKMVAMKYDEDTGMLEESKPHEDALDVSDRDMNRRD